MIDTNYIARSRDLLIEVMLAILAGIVTLSFYGRLDYQTYISALIVASIILIPLEIIRQAGGLSYTSRKAISLLEKFAEPTVAYETILERTKIFSVSDKAFSILLKHSHSLNQETLSQLRELNERLSQLTKFSELFKDMVSTSAKIRSEQRELLYQLLNRLEAVSLFSQQLQQLPGFTKESFKPHEQLIFETLIPSLRAKADALLSFNEYQKALAAYEEARRVGEQYLAKQQAFAPAIIEMTRIYIGIAQTFLALNRPKDAIQAYDKAIEISISGSRKIKGG